jgi:hypothetical protein
MTKEEFETIIKPIMLLNGKESQFIRTALLGNFQKWNEQKQLIIADVMQSLPKRLSNAAYLNAREMRYEDFVKWWDEQV